MAQFIIQNDVHGRINPEAVTDSAKQGLTMGVTVPIVFARKGDTVMSIRAFNGRGTGSLVVRNANGYTFVAQVADLEVVND